MMTIYTLGYTGCKMADIEKVVSMTGLMLIDTRISPRSRVATWDQSHFERVFGLKYLSVTALGNRNYLRGGEIAIANLEAGCRVVTPYLRTGQDVMLICACDHVERCHRKVVADALHSLTSCPVIHWSARDLANAATAPSGRAVRDMPVQLDMFGGTL